VRPSGSDFWGKEVQDHAQRALFALPVLRRGIRRQPGLDEELSFQTAMDDFHMNINRKIIIR